MWRGLLKELLPGVVVSEVSVGKSIHHSSLPNITSHYKGRWCNIIKLECIIAKSNGSQFRQIYSLLSLQAIHSLTQDEKNEGMHDHQIEVISISVNLFINSNNHNSLFNSNDAYLKLQLQLSMSPNSINSKLFTFSISITE